MPENEIENSPEETKEEPSESPSTEPQAGTASPFVYEGENLPKYLQGKTAEQVAQEYEQLVQALGHGQTQETPQETPAQALKAPEAQETSALAPPDPDLIYSDAARYQREYEAYRDQKENQRLQNLAQQYLAPLYASAGQTAMMAARQDRDRQDVWDKYEPEILSLVKEQNFQPQTKEQWDMVADIVAGRHRKDLVREEAERLAARGGTVTEGGAQGTESGGGERYEDAIDEFLASDHPMVREFLSTGQTKKQIKEAIAKMGLDPKDYIAQVTSGNVITSGKNRTIERQIG